MKKVVKVVFLSFAFSMLTLLVACSGIVSDPTPTVEPKVEPAVVPTVEPAVHSVTVSGVRTTSNINEQGEYDLNISGIGNNFTIKNGYEVKELRVSGIDNVITIEDGVTVDSFSMPGFDNVITIEDGATVGSFSMSGGLNEIIIEDGVTVGSFSMSGGLNEIIIEDGVTVGSSTMSGFDNTVFVPFGSSISVSVSGFRNVLQTRTTNSITGIWSFTYPATQCVDTYEFNANGTFNQTSLDEVAAGTYTFEETVVTGDRHPLSITFTSNNGLSACNGLSEDTTGLNFTPYISFTNAATIELFNDRAGGSTNFVYTKQ